MLLHIADEGLESYSCFKATSTPLETPVIEQFYMCSCKYCKSTDRIALRKIVAVGVSRYFLNFCQQCLEC